MPRTVLRRSSGFPALVSDRSWGGRVTRAEVNLDALGGNVRRISRHVSPAEVMAVVKADGYGHGAAAVARTALSHGASRLAVYTVSEGAALRAAGVAAPVLVFGPFTEYEAESMWRLKLTPTLTTLESAAYLQRHANGRVLDFHVKLDTGLNRAGVDPGDVVDFMRAVSERYPGLRHEGTYTHFAAAEEPDKSTAFEQLDVFRQAVKSMRHSGYPSRLTHASNSAATLDLPDARFSMVRTGIALYGYYPSETTRRDVALTPALQLVSEVTRVHEIPQGTGVGYGHEFRSRAKTTVALIPIGYGDGLPRSLGNGMGRVLLRGQPAPIIGRVSMDQITVDATGISGVQMGDVAVLIGGQGEAEQDADDVGAQAGTISYDILVRLLPRVPRLYVDAWSVVATSSGVS